MHRYSSPLIDLGICFKSTTMYSPGRYEEYIDILCKDLDLFCLCILRLSKCLLALTFLRKGDLSLGDLKNCPVLVLFSVGISVLVCL